MNKIAIIFFITLFAYEGFAQNRNVTNAILSYQSQDYKKAKDAIDKAAKNDKTKNDAKTWYWRGRIYKAMAQSSNKAYLNIVDKPGQKAVKYYNKAKELSKKGEEYYDKSDKEMGSLWSYFINNGVDTYNKKEFKKSMNNFLYAMKLKPNDTTAYAYGSTAAMQAKAYDTAKMIYNNAFENGYKKKNFYFNLIRIYKKREEKPEKALEIVRKAIKEYPEENKFRRSEISLMLKLDKKKEAITKIEEALKQNPNNPNLHFNLGVLYENADNNEKAIKSYKNCLKYDSTNYNALFNLGVLYYNMAVDKYNKANNLSMEEYKKKGDKIKQEGNDLLKKAIPYFKRSLKIKESKKINDILANTYSRLGQEEKAKKYRPDSK